MAKKSATTSKKKNNLEVNRNYFSSIESWKNDLENAINTSYNYLQKYPDSQDKEFNSVKLLLKKGLAMLENKTYEEKFSDGRKIFYYMKDVISKKESKTVLSKEIKKYQQDLALRGGLLIEKSHLNQDYGKGDAEILRYYDKHFGTLPDILEKPIAKVSILSIIAGTIIGVPTLTGNAIAGIPSTSAVYGAILLISGILGLFLAKKR